MIDPRPTTSCWAHLDAVIDRRVSELSCEWFGDEHPSTARFLTEAVLAAYFKRRASSTRTRPSLIAERLAGAVRWLLSRKSLRIAPSARAYHQADDPTFGGKNDQLAISLHLRLLALSTDR